MIDDDMPRLLGLFVTGTDTDVGKTWITSAVAACLFREGYRPGVIKPVATGIADPMAASTDAAVLLRFAGWPVTPETIALANPVQYRSPAAPTVAARAEGRVSRWEEVLAAVRTSISGWSARGAEVLLVEGAGGVCCPLAEGGKTMLDLIRDLDFPVLVVARKGLGTLGHSIAAAKVLKQAPTRIAGVILNCVPGDDASGLPERTAAAELAGHIAPVPVLHDGAPACDPAEIALAIERLGWYGRTARPRW